MGALHDLYAVQLTDIAISQAQHRLAHLPESASYQQAKSASQNAIAEMAALDKQSNDAGSEIAGLEKQAHEIDATLARLNKQIASGSNILAYTQGIRRATFWPHESKDTLWWHGFCGATRIRTGRRSQAYRLEILFTVGQSPSQKVHA